MRRLGYGLRPLAKPPRSGRPPRRPRADRGVPGRRRGLPRLQRDGRADQLASSPRYPSLVQRITLGNTHEGRPVYALKVSDNVAADESEPEVMFTANQHAREHLTVEMALYVLGELTSKYSSDARIQQHRRTRARSGSSRWSTRTASSTTSPPAPTARGARTASPTRARARSAPTSTATGATAGAAAAARARRSRPRPTAARARSRRRRRATCATSSTRASSAACSRSRRASTSTPTPSSCCGPTATPTPTSRPT